MCRGHLRPYVPSLVSLQHTRSQMNKTYISKLALAILLKGPEIPYGMDTSAAPITLIRFCNVLVICGTVQMKAAVTSNCPSWNPHLLGVLSDCKASSRQQQIKSMHMALQPSGCIKCCRNESGLHFVS